MPATNQTMAHLGKLGDRIESRLRESKELRRRRNSLLSQLSIKVSVVEPVW